MTLRVWVRERAHAPHKLRWIELQSTTTIETHYLYIESLKEIASTKDERDNMAEQACFSLSIEC